jgi:uncharacterized protein (DUF302 family)
MNMMMHQRRMLPIGAAVLSAVVLGLVFLSRLGMAFQRGHAMEVTQITVEHVRFASDKPFDEVTKDFLAQLGHEPHSDQELTTGIDPEKLRAKLKAAEGSSGFMLFTTYNHGALLRLAGQKRRAIQYVVGNPLFALEMTQHEIRDSLYAPLRVLIYEDASGKTYVEYDKPSTLFGQFGNEKATEVARMLDRKLEALVVRSIQ